MGLRGYLEEKPVRCAIVGAVHGVAFSCVPFGLELTILLAAVMPGVYWGFSFCHDGQLEILEETTTVIGLMLFNLHCLYNVLFHGLDYYAPLSVLVHGGIDILHHLHMYPSEKHVYASCPKYPMMCFAFDFGLGTAQIATLWLSSAFTTTT